MALLVHHELPIDQRKLIDGVVSTVGLALSHARLLVEREARVRELRESRARIVAATAAERRRIQRDLHDGAQHELLVTSMLLDQAARAAAPTALIGRARQQLDHAITNLRLLADDIHSPVLAERGLATAIDVIAERSPIPVSTEITEIVGRRFDAIIESVAYFVVCEAIANTYKHADATHIVVHAIVASDRSNPGGPACLVVGIDDDGRGGADAAGGSGLTGLRDRVDTIGGRMTIVDQQPGKGTSIRVELPCG